MRGEKPKNEVECINWIEETARTYVGDLVLGTNYTDDQVFAVEAAVSGVIETDAFENLIREAIAAGRKALGR